jgi:hypothetical protein
MEEDETVTGRTLIELLGQDAPVDTGGESLGDKGFSDGLLDEEGGVIEEVEPDEDNDKEPADGQDEEDE